MIKGVVVQELTSHTDERQLFREVVRITDAFFAEGFGQFSHAAMNPGTTKAWHVHWKQVDWWYVPIGALKLVLHDVRPESPTYRETMEILMGELYKPVCVRIPPGVAHGCKVIGGGTTHLFYITSRVYDPEDEGRIPHDDPEIGYDWLAAPPIK